MQVQGWIIFVWPAGCFSIVSPIARFLRILLLKGFIQPAAGDSGGALGVASYIYHSILNNNRSFVMQDAYLGPDFSQNQMKRALVNNGINFKEFSDEDLFKYVAQKISQDKIIGWFQGRMEFGPGHWVTVRY